MKFVSLLVLIVGLGLTLCLNSTYRRILRPWKARQIHVFSENLVTKTISPLAPQSASSASMPGAIMETLSDGESLTPRHTTCVGGHAHPAVVESSSFRVLLSAFRQTRCNAAPLQLQFFGMSVTLRDSGRTLVAAVSGTLRPGTVTAILGPSGSGKTVLLKALLGRTDANWAVGGLLTVNGDTHIGKYRAMIGSVPQDDVLHTELTVYRNVMYAAQLRLPRHWAAEQQSDLTRAVLESLGLAHVADVPIGDAENRGVSGGQRKRASIGVELVTAPQALLLDEPTKGLDSNTALELVSTLRRVAVETELTVGMAVNQPRAEIWNALDELLILSTGGRTVFHGHRSEVAAYMQQSFGLKFPPESNPADVVLDAVSARGDEMAEAWSAHITDTISSAASDDAAAVDRRDEIPWNGASILSQVRIAHMRYIEKQLSTLSTLYIEVGVSFVLGAVLGYSASFLPVLGVFVEPFTRISPSPFTAMPPQLHMYAFMSLGLATATAGVNVFVNDKGTYSRAVMCGSSRIAHYVGTVTASWYRLVIVTLAFASPNHLISKSSAPFGPYFILFYLVAWNMYAVGGLLALVSNSREAPLLSGLSAILYGCFSGFIGFPSPIKKLSFCFWAAQVLQEWRFYDTQGVFKESSSEWGWELGATSATFCIMTAMGLVYHVAAVGILVALGP
jgi:ABC-type multidrug transport system ATPase subunit